MTPTLQLFLVISAALFSIGLLAALSRRHAIFILIGIEMMLTAANLNFIAFWRFSPPAQQPVGVMIAIFSIAIAAAEAAVGLAMVIAVYRHYRTTNVDQLDQLKGLNLNSRSCWQSSHELDYRSSLADPGGALCGVAGDFESVETAAQKRSRARDHGASRRTRNVGPGILADTANA